MENELIGIAMDMILKAGDARLHIHEALAYMKEFAFDKAEQSLSEGESDLRASHRTQTDVIQNEARGNTYQYSMLFAHAQDTLMTVNSEYNLAKEMLGIFRMMDERYCRKGEPA